ncbi:Molybdopterin-binding oxidoreductase [4Fe-4S] cluster binding and molybdopterin cofactor binding site containing [hydrothermal vent metagenome]|uniref:Molybdopterin-binding oxidoreductase, [4Fe-4S] cluster binding and molybdopterin cofactor binding site containing n=1 Tax=hydrothermal vent metagenome TaxID=652676 RepID=A0A3B1CSK5_9ZZZZ
MLSDKRMQSTACILCSINCGLKIQVEHGEFTRILGDKKNPHSEGYLCQKALGLNHYQNHTRRLTHPMRKRSDGRFEKIDWGTAISEVAGKLKELRRTFGGSTIAYYGGGGQGNHLGGAYAQSFREALGTPYVYSALAQEKTGSFWVNGKLFGRQSCHITEGIEEAEYTLIIGANPWQSHGIIQARKVLKNIAKNPKRKLIVIDPRLTETAALADIHLQVRPGMDAFLLAALLGVIVNEGLEDRIFLEKYTTGFDEISTVLKKIPIDHYAKRAGIDPDLVRRVAREFATARSASVRHDLGLEQSLHSTLNTYLEKLLFLITGHFGKPGCNTLHTLFAPILTHSKEPEEGGICTKVTGMKEICQLFPPNILPAEIDTEHPDRIRAVFVDSSNPIQSAADTQAYRKAFKKLELLVVLDVAETETAQLADYILPAPSQYEKWEASFFNLSFPKNYFQLRAPILPIQGDTLPEPEIYYRLLVAMKAIPRRFPILETASKIDRQFPVLNLFFKTLMATLIFRPNLKPYLPAILYATLGKALPKGAQAAAVCWGLSHRYVKRYAKQVQRAGFRGKGTTLRESLFKDILESDTAVTISQHTYEEMWDLMGYKDKRIRLLIPEMLDELSLLKKESEDLFDKRSFPFVLSAGERRANNANQIYRDPSWRKKDSEGALRIHPDDARKLGLMEGKYAKCESENGVIKVKIKYDDAMQCGYLSLPHGYGMYYPDPENPEQMKQSGPSINQLTSANHCDATAKTPYHKYVPVRLQPMLSK